MFLASNPPRLISPHISPLISAQFQGPSLTLSLHGCQLSSETICQLQSPPPFKLRDATCRYGTGLLGSYFLADLLEVASGDMLYLFDPTGSYLAPSSAPSAMRRDASGAAFAAPVGQAYSIKGN